MDPQTAALVLAIFAAFAALLSLALYLQLRERVAPLVHAHRRRVTPVVEVVAAPGPARRRLEALRPLRRLHRTPVLPPDPGEEHEPTWPSAQAPAESGERETR